MHGFIRTVGQHGITNERLKPWRYWEQWGSWHPMPSSPDLQDVNPEPVCQCGDGLADNEPLGGRKSENRN